MLSICFLCDCDLCSWSGMLLALCVVCVLSVVNGGCCVLGVCVCVLYMRNQRSVLTGVCPVTVVLMLFEFCVCVHRVVVPMCVHVCWVCSV